MQTQRDHAYARYSLSHGLDDESEYESEDGTIYKASKAKEDLSFFKLRFLSTLLKKEKDYLYVMITQGRTISFMRNHVHVTLDCPLLYKDINRWRHEKNNKNFILALHKIMPEIIDQIRQQPAGRALFPKGFLGKGSYAYSRVFSNEDQTKESVVLSPNSDDFSYPEDIYAEIQTKHRFYNTMNPGCSHMFFDPLHNHRLVVPRAQGIQYARLSVQSLSFIERLDIFISAVDVLQKCHDQGFVYIDLKEDNIFYNAQTKTSELIDGGSCVPIGVPLSDIFDCVDRAERSEMIKQSWHIAPECWAIVPSLSVAVTSETQKIQRTPAAVSMDVFSLAAVLIDMRLFSTPDVGRLLSVCMSEDPEQRLSLCELKLQLKALHSASFVIEENALSHTSCHSFLK